jgi:Na+/H+-dicarboxylate symporter
LENLNRNDSRVTIWIINEELGTKGIVVDWIKPFGTIFINLLKMIAVPLIVVSLIVVADLKDISKLSKLVGERYYSIYVLP